MKIKRISLLLTTIACIIAAFVTTAYARSGSADSCITDKGAYINDADEVLLDRRLREAEQRTGVAFRVYVYTYSTSTGYVDMHDYEREMGESFDDLVLLVISYEYGAYYYELFTKGAPHTDITDKEANRILDNKGVYDNIKSGKIYEGIDEYITLAEKAVSGKLRNSFKAVFVPSLIISVLVAGGISAYIFFRYRRKLHAASYPLEKYASLNLNVSEDKFITKTVSRVRVNSASSSGTRSSGGGGSRGRR